MHRSTICALYFAHAMPKRACKFTKVSFLTSVVSLNNTAVCAIALGLRAEALAGRLEDLSRVLTSGDDSPHCTLSSR